ncbi:FHA domain-containing protein [Cohnella nanjingensis]|uniref:FHA domain-containing protein n=1 Tax=Cohnella nanjingensis TaxID=1387779 RepID=A0A7X0VJ90_9BACL|nr:FHA domain-containing protein [Cohnella nanjingensis]MBB6674469.1 FHA domain-containing protein [Cohnella nanjingensis]
MKTVVGRIRISGRRAFATIGTLGSSAIGAKPAAASMKLDATAAQNAIGTLPLLAAMGIGIVVAALAVVAFLQMTARGKNRRDEYALPDEASPEQAERETSADLDGDWDEDRGDDEGAILPDYTIPLSRLGSAPEPLVQAGEGEPRLCGLQGEFAGASFKLSARPLSIGRDAAQCGLVFPFDSGEISRKHCSLRYEAERGAFLLEDHGSSNGTFLPDGSRLQAGERYELRPGERFALSGGLHLFEVRV